MSSEDGLFATLKSPPKATLAILIALVGSYLISTLGTFVYNVYFHPLAKYPGPASRAVFYLPDLLSKLKGTGYKDVQRLHAQYGKVVRILPNTLSYTTAQAWKDIYSLRSDRTEMAKDPAFYIRRKDQPTNIIIANQTDHARIRKLLAHAFSDGALLEQESLLTLYFDLLVARLKQQIDGPAHGRVDMMAWYNFTTFDIIGDLVLGESFGALESGEYHPWIRNVFESAKLLGVIRLTAAFPAFGLLFKLVQFLIPSISSKRAAHLEFTGAKIEKRLDRKTDRKDFTTYILRYNDERGMTREEILVTSRILLTAGSETTASLLTGATYFLLQNPEMLRRLQSEVREAFKTADEITLRSVSTTGRLPYLEAVLQESLRCYPPVPAVLPRITGPEGALIDGAWVPGNISVGVHQWSACRSSDNFASPDTFAPERWLPNAPAKYRDDDPAAMQPFSLGPRGCIGKRLAYFELRSVLSRVLWHFDMELEDASQRWLEQKEYAIWDKPPLRVRLTHRAGS
ncbi:hypothetical protein MMC07_001059 [Pseudocyphellaria aurata]|nr:hypothetical protein [Pseudocyphellaria aurata]